MDHQQPEIDENGLEWWTVDHRNAPRDIVPQEQVHPLTQRPKTVAHRHANGERFWHVPPEQQLVFDANGRAAAYRQPPGAEITTSAPQLRQRNEEEDR